METKFFYNEETGRCYSKLTGRRIFGGAEQVCRAKYLNGGLKQTLDQNERLEDEKKRLNEALYYSLSLNREQDKKIQYQDKEIQHLKNILGSVLPALNLNFPSLDFNER
ncbi:hypothetical protein KVK47_03805 [Helicobacter pylori]|nr:hypothetical protein KVK47_03805 [Helicobacter pylori]